MNNDNNNPGNISSRGGSTEIFYYKDISQYSPYIGNHNKNSLTAVRQDSFIHFEISHPYF